MSSIARRKDAGHGLVFNIQRYSLHDGSGIRTLVFLSGCPLRCNWCCNPEGQTCAPRLGYDAEKCIGREACGDACRKACEDSAIDLAADDKVWINQGACTGCGECVVVCPPRALERFGDGMSVDEVLDAAEHDAPFFARSGGGITLSGGEPLVQAEFATRLLESAHDRGIDTALETSGCVPWSHLENACRHADQVFYDVKCMDPERHMEGTGLRNERILENLRRLRERFPELPVTVRTPVVPGFNDAPGEIRAICDFVAALPGTVRYEILPYHHFGESKYRKLGLTYPLPEVEPPSAEQMAVLQRIVDESGLSYA